MFLRLLRRLMVGQRTLTPLILVRIQAKQPKYNKKSTALLVKSGAFLVPCLRRTIGRSTNRLNPFL